MGAMQAVGGDMIRVCRMPTWMRSASSRVISDGRRDVGTCARRQISLATRGDTREKSFVRRELLLRRAARCGCREAIN